MTNTGKIDEWALHAFVDGELARDSAAEIEAALAADPEAARDVADWRRQREALKQAYDGVLDEPVPPALAAVLAGRRSVSRLRPLMNLAAGLALLAIGATGGWVASGQWASRAPMSLADEAIAAHEVFVSEVKHPVEVSASDSDHLAAWLSKRIGTEIRLPDLSADGYTLLGGRLLVADEGPAAQLMYEDANKKRLTVFLTANAGHEETAVRVERRQGLIACYWLGDALSFAVAGDMELEPMMKLARDIYDQFEA
jgi:anti-sigma factor RsiW